MSSATESHWQTVKYMLLSLLLAGGLWYMVIGSAQVEAQFDLRVDYRGLPAGLVVRDGMVNRISVRLRGPGELLRGLHARDLSYTVDLAEVKKGANVLPLSVDSLADLKSYEVVDVSPSRLVLEVDVLTERVLPLEVNITPLPDAAPLRLTNVLLEPSFVTVKGPESQIKPLEHLSVSFDPTQDMNEGTRAMSVAIAGPEQVDITPPVTTLRYTLALKTTELELRRVVQLDAENRARFEVKPRTVDLSVEVPEGRVRDAEYQAAIRVVVRPPRLAAPGDGAEAPVLVVLPAGARLARVSPSAVTITLKTDAGSAGSAAGATDGSQAPDIPDARDAQDDASAAASASFPSASAVPSSAPSANAVPPAPAPDRGKDGARVDSSARLPLSPVPAAPVSGASRAAVSLP